jgi:uncharacterized protein YggT (Ycf19 family)
MDALLIRLVLILGFLAYMAAIYLVLHIVFARLIQRPQSQMLWFFSVVTRPLTRPVRRFLPPDTPDARVRLVALGVYAVVWLATKVLVAQLRGGPFR